MKKYYIHNGVGQVGPFDKSELVKEGVDKETPIWFESLKDWTTIGEVEELSDLFLNKPPEFKGSIKVAQTPLFKKEEKATSVINKDVPFFKTIFNKKNRIAIIAIGLIMVGVASLTTWFIHQNTIDKEKVREVQEQAAKIEEEAAQKAQEAAQKEHDLDSVKLKEQQKTPQELEEELLAKEQHNPKKYLSVYGNMKENKVQTRSADLFHHSEYRTDGYIINGFINNSASVANFKDVVITLTFYTQTQTILEQTNFTVLKYCPPHTRTPFDYKVFPVQGSANYRMEVKKASSD